MTVLQKIIDNIKSDVEISGDKKYSIDFIIDVLTSSLEAEHQQIIEAHWNGQMHEVAPHKYPDADKFISNLKNS